MSNPPINISSMSFDEIKTSLIDYLKSQTNFNSYNFSSSALSTLVNVLSYNTLFYAYYANMIANESFLSTSQIPQNIIEHLKPLGYVINGTNSSKIIVKIKGNDAQITAYSTRFTGTNSSGNVYIFYPIKNYILNPIQETEIELYNSDVLVLNKTINDPTVTLIDKLNLTTQSYYLGGLDIDIKTISVYVNEEKWEQYDPYETIKNTTNKIFFIERRNNGFYLLFGRTNLTDSFGVVNSLSISANDVVKISFIKPVGVLADGVALSGSPVGTIVSSTISTGGGSPDIDIIKTFAPKLFASSNRAVTKDDYYGMILNSNLLPASITTSEQIVVWGGDELDNALPGRVFFSLADTKIISNQMNSLASFLKEKSILSVQPEYIPAKTIELNTSFNYKGPQSSSIIRTTLNSFFNSVQSFNKKLSLNDFLLYMTETFPSTELFDITSTVLKFVLSTNSQNTITLYNQIKKPTIIGTVVPNNSFIGTNTSNPDLEIRDIQRTANSNDLGELVIYDTKNRRITNYNVGIINYKTGFVSIKTKYLLANNIQDVYCSVIPENPKLILSKFNSILVLNPTVNKV